MSNYTKTTDFEAKDSLPTGDSGKIIRGAEFETEFDAISTAIATKADTAGPTFTGTLTFETISDGTIGVTAFVDEDDMTSDSATLVPTQQSVKAYVDSQVTAQDLDFQADSGGALSIDLDSETLTFTGGTGIDTSGALNAVTFAIDSTVATLTGTQTLTNKTLTSPDVNTPDIDGGTIDGATIATSDITVGTGKTLNVSGGTLTLADNQISGDKVEGGTIASTTITSLASTTVDTTNLEVTNIKAKDGTSAGSIADTTGVVTLASSVLTTTDINGGTIDGATIGGTTAAAGSFTTVSATGNITVGGTVDGRDVATDGTKLDGIEASADVTDTTNVTAAGALMDSELTSEASVKALNQGVATTDSPTFAGLTTTANVSFGDNDKAIFGAGSDLQIYHTGSQSIIRDAGAGDLQLLADANITLKNSAGTTTKAEFISGGAVNLYHNNSAKLATTSTGIDVTGNTLSDSLTANGSLSGLNAGSVMLDYNGSSVSRLLAVGADATTTGTLKVVSTASDGGPYIEALTVDSTGIDVTGGIAATDDSTFTAASGDIFVTASTGSGSGRAGYRVDETSTNGFEMVHDNTDNAFFISRRSGSATAKDVLKIGRSTGDISFYEDTGTTAKFFWDASAESLGIGTSSPAYPLDVSGSAGDVVRFTGDANNSMRAYLGSGYQIFQCVNSGTTNQFGYVAGEFFAQTAGTERMRIDASGNLQLGNTTGSRRLNVFSDTDRYTVDLRNESGYNSGELSGIVFSGRYDSSNNVTDMASIGGGKENTTDGNFGGRLSFFTRPHNGSDTERMRIDSSGNVGIGLTPENSSGTWRNFEQSGMNLAGRSAGGVDGMIGTNYVFKTDNSEVYKYTAGTSRLFFDANEIRFQQAASGTAGTAISWSEAMRIDSSGNLLVGKTATGYSANGAEITSTGLLYLPAGSASAPSLTFSGDPNTGIGFGGADILYFSNGGSESARLDASGNLLVGTTSESTWESVAGFRARSSGSTTITRDGNPPLYVNRLTSDGTIVQFQKGTTTVGNISSRAGTVLSVILDPRTGGAGLTAELGGLRPTDQTGAITDNAIDLGKTTGRFKDLYLSGGVYVGGTGSANKLDDYEEGTWTPVLTANDGTTSLVTFSSLDATYVKVGKVVHVRAYMASTSALSGTTSAVKITGLPFGVAGGAAYSSVSIWPFAGFSGLSSGEVLIARNQSGGSYIVIQKTDGGSSLDVTQSDFGGNLNFALQCSYEIG